MFNSSWNLSQVPCCKRRALARLASLAGSASALGGIQSSCAGWAGGRRRHQRAAAARRRNAAVESGGAERHGTRRRRRRREARRAAPAPITPEAPCEECAWAKGGQCAVQISSAARRARRGEAAARARRRRRGALCIQALLRAHLPAASEFLPPRVFFIAYFSSPLRTQRVRRPAKACAGLFERPSNRLVSKGLVFWYLLAPSPASRRFCWL